MIQSTDMIWAVHVQFIGEMKYIYVYRIFMDSLKKRVLGGSEEMIFKWTVYSTVTVVWTTLFHVRNSMFCRKCLYVFHLIIISDYFITQNQTVGFCNAGTVCLLRGRNFVLKYVYYVPRPAVSIKIDHYLPSLLRKPWLLLCNPFNQLFHP